VCVDKWAWLVCHSLKITLMSLRCKFGGNALVHVNRMKLPKNVPHITHTMRPNAALPTQHCCR